MAGSPPTYRRPLGVYTRPTPDFFEHQAAWVGASWDGTGSPINPLTVGLYNNATDGSILRIYKVVLSSNTGTRFYADVKHEQSSDFHADAIAVRPDLPRPWGFSIAGQNNTTPIFRNRVWFHTIGQPGSSITNTAAMMEFTFQGPLWILPPGWSLAFETTEANVQLSATFWYSIFTDP